MAYSAKFFDENTLQSASQVLECKKISQRLFQAPSDRHVYAAKFVRMPLRYNKKLRNFFSSKI
jgi:hypothetical protein